MCENVWEKEDRGQFMGESKRREEKDEDSLGHDVEETWEE